MQRAEPLGGLALRTGGRGCTISGGCVENSNLQRQSLCAWRLWQWLWSEPLQSTFASRRPQSSCTTWPGASYRHGFESRWNESTQTIGGVKVFYIIIKSPKKRATETIDKSCEFYFSYCTGTNHFPSMVGVLELCLFQASQVPLAVFWFQKFHPIRFIGTV